MTCIDPRPSDPTLDPGPDPAVLAGRLTRSLARRAMLQAAAVGAVGPGVLLASGATSTPAAALAGLRVLQPGTGQRRGRYVRARAEEIFWGRLPNRRSEPVAVVPSGSVVTLDTISHEGVLEDQGQDPRRFFETYGVPESQVLRDAVAVAANARHDGPGPHVVTGPIASPVPGPVTCCASTCSTCRCAWATASSPGGTARARWPGSTPRASWAGPRTGAMSTRAGRSASSPPSSAREGGCAAGCPDRCRSAST